MYLASLQNYPAEEIRITEQNVNYAISLVFEGQEEEIVEIDKDLICHTLQ